MRRRDFLARAGMAAAGALAANAASAQPARKRPHRVAVIGVGHYHAFSPPNYLRILHDQQCDIVGIHDPDAAIASRYAAQAGSTPYTDYRALVEKTKPEFVIALGHHAAMPAPFRFLVDAGVPFLMEKPWGVDDATVRQLATYAESKQAWVAAPMPFRYSWWAETAKRMRERGELGAISHIHFRFDQPGVQRYIDSGSSWILSKKEAGGGALLNLGIHGFDICRYILGEEPTVVAAVTSHATQRREVEDFAQSTMTTPGGVICVNEASYTWPTNGSDQERQLSAERAVLIGVTAGGEGVRIVGSGRDEIVRAPEHYVAGWPGVVNDCLNRIERGDPPQTTAHDCARAVTLVFDSYRKAGETS